MSRPIAALFAVLLTAFVLTACGGSADNASPADAAGGAGDATATDATPLDTSAGDITAVDTRATIDVAVDVPPDLSAPLCGDDCPDGFCDETTGRCVWCGETNDCLRGEWCRDNRCVRTACVPATSACEGFDIKICEDDGESYGAPEVCPDDKRCTPAIGGAECLDIICEPGDSHCADLELEECNEAGTGWRRSPCQPGAVCREGEGCQPYRNTVLLIFDTSGSMGSDPMGLSQGNCICGPGNCEARPYPTCENPLCPRSKLGMSKFVFTQLFSIIATRSVNFVMMRFPQPVSRAEGDCNDMFGTGHYQTGLGASDLLGDDDHSHVTEDGGWYDEHLDDILCVPFPTSEEQDTFAEARLWMDFDEQVGPTTDPCETDGDCPGGYCDTDWLGNRVCFRHTNPELRATGNTPLGHSMFYAGEYIRRYVAPTGRPCETDADCRNVNYRCGPDLTCFDPLGHCRTISIVLFTDGVEDPATSPGDYRNPRVNAKRFRYGLSCSIDADCGDGATCTGGICDGYPRPNGSAGAAPRPSDPEPSRLLDYAGHPLQVTVNVIDMGDGEGASANRLIADEGGGTYYSVTADDPDGFLNALTQITDIKTTLACTPRFPAGWEE